MKIQLTNTLNAEPAIPKNVAPPKEPVIVNAFGQEEVRPKPPPLHEQFAKSIETWNKIGPLEIDQELLDEHV